MPRNSGKVIAMDPQGMNEGLERLLARQEIYDRICDHSRGVDRLDSLLQRSVFYDDATVDLGFFKGGPDEFVAHCQAALRRFSATHHLIGQARIDVDDEVAFGEI